VVNFSWTSVASNPLTLAFQNLSVPLAATDSVTWQFGDGTSSNAVNPVHTYANAGTYTVCLRVKKNNNVGNTTTPCVREICKTVVIQSPCNLVVDFNWTVTQTNPLRIEFHNLSTPLSNTDSIRWTFGDGASSNDVNPVHTYNVAGTYVVCLRVQKATPAGSAPCVREICKTIVVTAPCNMVVDFNWTVTQTNPLRLEFHNLTTPIATNDSIRWTFGDGTSSNAPNPVHIYTAPGTYTVCLRIIRYNGSNTPCIREICKTVVVTAPCNMVPDFTWTATQSNPLRIEFHNTSTNILATDSMRWTFGDGSSSSDLNPVHTYAAPGTYTVCLKIIRYYSNSTTPCVREICKTVVVYAPCNMVPDFTWTVTQTNPLRIEFHNTSTNTAATDSIRWSFGDGTFSNDLNPVHTYTAPGTYTVCLRITRYNAGTTAPCVREICKTIVVTAPCTLVVNFTSQPDPAHPLRIKFTNTSTPINATDSVRWTFGDGSSVNGLQSDPNVANPTHDYANAGTYVVCLRVKKNNSATPPNQVTCVREKCNTIVVTAPCNFPVNFSWRLDSLNNRKVYFTNLSVPPTAGSIAVWTFGDGSSATSWNAIHEYALPGSYVVCLKVYLGQNSNCVREICDTVYIPVPVPPCTQLSKYHHQVFPNDNQKYKFTPDYINTTFQYTWTFGDGTGSHDPIAEHRYAQPGIYVACLTVWRSNTCASTTCHEINVLPQINCDTAHAGYTFVRNNNIPNKIQFFANATLPIIDQVWTITRVGGGVTTPPVTLHENNPIYLFQDTGYFRVCLRATLQGGCVKEYCNYIRIEQVSNICELQAFPNPATAVVNVNLFLTQPEMINASVYNNLNVVVLQQNQQGNTGNNLITLNIGNLVAGQYTIRLVYGNRVCYARFQKM
jgi:PKD repeat protein